MIIPTRILCRPGAGCHDFDLQSESDAYTDDVLATIRDSRFNAVWMPVVLREISTSKAFPALGRHAAANQALLARLVERCGRYGVRLYLALHEPLCLSAEHPLWDDYPECQGVRMPSPLDHLPMAAALCTSEPRVRDFLREGAADIVAACPEIAGLIIVSRGDRLTHCASLGELNIAEDGTSDCRCNRCAKRPIWDIPTEVINLMAEGVRSESADMAIVCDDSGWTDLADNDTLSELVGRLRSDVVLLSGADTGDPLDTGFDHQHDGPLSESSLARGGLSRRFRAMRLLAEAHGLGIMAKAQVASTLEMPTAPSIPAIPNVTSKLAKLKSMGISGVLAGWPFGGHFSPNTVAAGLLLDAEDPDLTADEGAFLAEVAQAYFGAGCQAADVVGAWSVFSDALSWLPHNHAFLQSELLGTALAVPFRMQYTDRPVRPAEGEEEWGDRLDEANTLSWPETARRLTGLLPRWEGGIDQYEEGLAPVLEGSSRARDELGVARYIYHAFRSLRNLAAFHPLRMRYLALSTPEMEGDLAQAIARVMEDELEHLPRILPLLEQDPRLGCHAGTGLRLISCERIREKLQMLEHDLAELNRGL